MKIYDSHGTRAICTAALGSVTIAMKARRALSAANIRCDVVKVKGQSGTSRGCIYGIEYPCELSGSVQRVLASAAIHPR